MDKFKVNAYQKLIDRLSLKELITLQSGLQRLLGITLSDSKSVPTQVVGICHNWAAMPGCAGYTGTIISLVRYFAASWPSSNSPGSDACFPVKSNYCFQSWEGPNLIQRASLMRYIIKRLKDIIRRRQRKAEQPTYDHAA